MRWLFPWYSGVTPWAPIGVPLPVTGKGTSRGGGHMRHMRQMQCGASVRYSLKGLSVTIATHALATRSVGSHAVGTAGARMSPIA